MNIEKYKKFAEIIKDFEIYDWDGALSIQIFKGKSSMMISKAGNIYNISDDMLDILEKNEILDATFREKMIDGGLFRPNRTIYQKIYLPNADIDAEVLYAIYYKKANENKMRKENEFNELVDEISKIM